MCEEREVPFSFAKHSSIGCGGLASVAYYPKSVEELTGTLQGLEGAGTPYLVLGNLTNVLPLEGGFDGAVLRTTRLSGISLGKKCFVYAGTSSGKFLHACQAAGLSGGEFLEGIPCTMGGALYMNAGAAGRYIAELVEYVLLLRAGKLITLSLAECDYAYKHSVFMGSGDVIVGACLRLKESTMSAVKEQIAMYRAKRAHLPKGRSMGCVFKNPAGRFAGELIEGCHLKGLRIGGAKISEKHANFILNDRQATAEDILALIARMKDEVYTKYRICLQEEIQFIGTKHHDFNG